MTPARKRYTVLVWSLMAVLVCVPAFSAPIRTLVNPYAGIDWSSVGHHRANLHTHSTESDGSLSPNDVIDFYRTNGYTALALTDHNECSYPWQNWGRDPGALGMLAIPGNEYSRHDHICGYFLCHETPSGSEEQTLTEIAAQGGVANINHPGRYWGPDPDGSIPLEVIQKYATWYTDFPGDVLMGVEVFNSINRHPEDIDLWDALLGVMMPNRPIWGFANDDMHFLGVGALPFAAVSWNVFLTATLDEASVRAAMTTGQGYFCTVTTQIDPNLWDANQVPVITGVTHDEAAGTIAISATSGGLPLPDADYRWISGGELIHSGPVLDYQNTPGVTNYIRAELAGPGGTSFTNPFGILSESGRVIVYISPADAVYAGARWTVDNDETWYESGQELELAPGQHTIRFNRVSAYQTPAPITVTVTKDETTMIGADEGALYVYDPSQAIPAAGMAALTLLVIALLAAGWALLPRIRTAKQH